MSRRRGKSTPLYEGAIKANVIGSVVILGETFTLIHPGYDAQGRRRQNWTQVVHGDVPVWEWKVIAPQAHVLAKFKEDFARYIGKRKGLLKEALRQVASHRRSVFRDGSTGEAPAPGLPSDGRPEGALYPA